MAAGGINARRAAKETYGRIDILVRVDAISIAPQDIVLADVMASFVFRVPTSRRRFNLPATFCRKNAR